MRGDRRGRRQTIQFGGFAFELIGNSEKKTILVMPALSRDARQPPVQVGFLSQLDPLGHW
jgi:hypothetical protein